MMTEQEISQVVLRPENTDIKPFARDPETYGEMMGLLIAMFPDIFKMEGETVGQFFKRIDETGEMPNIRDCNDKFARRFADNIWSIIGLPHHRVYIEQKQDTDVLAALEDYCEFLVKCGGYKYEAGGNEFITTPGRKTDDTAN